MPKKTNSSEQINWRHGNKNAVGHGAPYDNKNAVKHGAYSTVHLKDLPPDAQQHIMAITLNIKDNLLMELQKLTIDANTIQLGNASNLSVLRCKVSLTVTSDERDKADIVEIKNGLDFITKTNPIQYVSNQRVNYIDEENLSDEEKEKKQTYGLCEYDRKAHEKGEKKGTRKRVGVKAQQVQEALREVYGTSDYANIVNDNLYDVENVPDDVESQLTVAYTEFIPFLIGAVQELNRKIKMLEEKVNA